MPGRLRIFISSTMEDLENERDMVVDRLQNANFEPVNAEGFTPNGSTSWDRILQEIETCHVFMLLSGLRYGWVPTTGPLSEKRISVTHGEYLAARDQGLPVLPFFKILKYGSDSASDDAKARDAFRQQVGDWDKAQFRTEFITARDLAEKAVASVTRMLTDEFLRDQLAKRRETASPPPALQRFDKCSPAYAAPLELPAGLTTAVAEGRAVLWAGSGISMPAGLPSASALGAEMARSIQESVADYIAPPVGSGIASVASDFEMVLGRPFLLARLLELLNLPGGVKPTPQHLAAVALFPRIITTNYDGLFESAAQQLNSGHALVLGPNLPEPVPEKFIWKIHGDPSRSDVLVVSEADIEEFGTFTSTLVANLRPVLSRGPLLIAGTSLRDPSIMRLFHELRGGYQGYWPVPAGNPLAVARCKAMGLQPLPLLLEDVLGALRRRWE